MTVAAVDLGTAVAAVATHDYRWLYVGGAAVRGWVSVVAMMLLIERVAPDRIPAGQ